MKTTKIKIRNLFGITETELDGKNVEVTGKNGVGKTSIIDAIKYALTNDSERDYILKKGETEGEILIETDTGLYIDRKKRANQADYKSIKDGGKVVSSPEAMLKTIFTPLQLDPVKFIQLSKKEQNRAILDLIEFNWDLNWIKEQFGEIPPDVNYEQNILQVLNDIQAENGHYFQTRQDINRELRNKKAFVEEIAETIPLNYEAEKEIQVSSEREKIANEREELSSSIERMRAEIKAAEDKLTTLDGKLTDKIELAESAYREKVAKLDSDMQVADEYINKEKVDTSADEEEVKTAEEMKKHLNEFYRMKRLQEECEKLADESNEYTEKIELARELPGKILETATIPVEGLTVEDGVPLINGLPISNLSEGEKLNLCVDVALSKPNNLQIILIDGAEKLSDDNRAKLYEKCKASGLQFIATRTTNSDDMEVNYL